MRYTALLLLILAGCSSAVDNNALPVITLEETMNYRTVDLQNELLRLEFIPDSMGRLSQIEYLPGKQKFFIPFELRRVIYDPLLSRMESNGVGLRDFFWKVKDIGSSLNPMQVVDRQPGSIEFFTEYYGPMEASLRRTVTLGPGSLIFNITSILTSKKTGAPLQAAPWINLIPHPLSGQQLVIPAEGNRAGVGSFGCIKLPEPALIHGNDQPEAFVAPARNWVASVYPREKLVLALISAPEFLNGSVYYFWRGKLCGLNVKTMEMILPEKSLAAGAAYPYSFRIAVFPGLTDIKEICGTTAIDCRMNEEQLEMILVPAEKWPGGPVSLSISGKSLGSVNTAPCPAGRMIKVHFKHNDLKGHISGILPDGGKFSLLEKLK